MPSVDLIASAITVFSETAAAAAAIFVLAFARHPAFALKAGGTVFLINLVSHPLFLRWFPRFYNATDLDFRPTLIFAELIVVITEACAYFAAMRILAGPWRVWSLARRFSWAMTISLTLNVISYISGALVFRWII